MVARSLGDREIYSLLLQSKQAGVAARQHPRSDPLGLVQKMSYSSTYSSKRTAQVKGPTWPQVQLT